MGFERVTGAAYPSQLHATSFPLSPSSSRQLTLMGRGSQGPEERKLTNRRSSLGLYAPGAVVVSL